MHLKYVAITRIEIEEPNWRVDYLVLHIVQIIEQVIHN